MCTIRPFPAIRYAGTGRDVSALIAPPYDVLSESDRDALLQRHPRNFVVLDLPHVPPKNAGPPAVYEAAAAALRAWLADGTLVRDPQPALYVYQQRFAHAGTEYVRRMFFARLRLEQFGAGMVYPHEQTFGGPKEDRLALTKATRVNLSPILGLYEDERNEVAELLETAARGDPLLHGRLDGVDNRIWAVHEPRVIEGVVELMRPRAVYIADGHHRYGTALLYRDWLAAQHGPLPDGHPADSVLCVLCAMEDPGLLILPTHRVLTDARGLTPDRLRADPRLNVADLDVAAPDDAPRALAAYGAQAVALYSAATRRYCVVTPRSPDVLDDLEPAHSAAWRRLALAFLHSYLIGRVAMQAGGAGPAPAITYVKSAVEAVQLADRSGGSAFLLQPTTMPELRAVCRAGDLMPQKSTYFYPKLASGLVVNPLTD